MRELFSDQNLAKGTIDDLLCESLHKLVKIGQKCFASYTKVLGEEIKFLKRKSNSYIRAKPQLLEEFLCKIGLKNRKYFFAQQYQIFRKF